MADKKTVAKKPAAKKTELPKTLEELQQALVTVRQDVIDARKSHAQGELVNPHVLTVKRKEIARLLTAIKATELAAKEEK